MGDSAVSKWAAGASCEYNQITLGYPLSISPASDGPVLSQTDLYLLNTELQLHPILQGTDGSFHLIFNLVTGMSDLAYELASCTFFLPRFDGRI